MAYNIITPSNSLSAGLTDADADAFLLVSEGGYISNLTNYAYKTSGGSANITVRGTIVSRDFFGIYASGLGSNQIQVSSTGFVSGSVGIDLYGSDNVVSNQGKVVSTLVGGAGIFINGAQNMINNAGVIEGSFGVRSFYYDLQLSNSGSIFSTNYAIQSNGGAVIGNSGTITGTVSVEETIGLTNSGVIEGVVAAGANSGGASAIVNYGAIHGNVVLGSGDDTVDTSTGVITGVVNLSDGADTYTGGDGADHVVGGAGADAIDLGGGNDQYRAVNADGKDDIDGGDGNDTYNASACTLSVGVDLSAATSSLTVGNDLILNFENIIGGSANDTLTGSDDGNRIDGGAGSDILGGGDGNDRILGGAGTDTITGGLGRDVLTGGTATGLNEADKFVFSDGDSGTKASTRDVITDFTDHGSASAPYATGADTIDLHLIDANTVAAANQAFSFNSVSGAAFSGVAGSLIWLQTGQFALVLGDTDGDSKADFVIQLNGVHALLASDFVL